ncbi:MAG: hypothetical protein AB1806_10795 [Acidobacteriota bacterium]
MASRHVRALALGGLAAVTAVLAATATASQGRTASERPPALVVDFTALSADGTPMTGLQPADVEIRISGRVRKVRSLRLVPAAADPTPAPTPLLPRPYGSNNAVFAGRSIVLVVDEESIVAGHEPLLRNAVEGLLAHLTPADRVMVVALPYGGVKVPFTSEPLRVRVAMSGLLGQGGRDEGGSAMACRTRRFLEALDGFLSTQGGRQSPLTMVLFTAGMAAPRRDAPMALAPGMCELLVEHFRRITVTAAAARANLYLAQPADIGMSAAGWRESVGGANFLGSDNPLEGIEHLAGATGAERLPLDATGTASLDRVARESAAYYVAELEPERGEVFGRSRPVSVRIVRQAATITVRARPEITFAEVSQRAGKTRLAVPDLLLSSEAYPELRLRVAGFTVREAAGQLRVGVVVEPVDPGVVLESVGAVLVESNGRIAGRWFARDTAARPLLGAIAAPPGTYRLRVAGIDTSGRPGAAEDVVDVRLSTVGPLTLGSLMLGVSREQGIAPQLEFSTEPVVIASFDIYGGVAGMGLAATLEVARDTDGPALVSVPLGLARADEHRVVATGSVPTGALPPGDYVVRGVIQLEDGTIGRVVRTLRKVTR